MAMVRQSCLIVYFPAMPDALDDQKPLLRVDEINDSVIADGNPVNVPATFELLDIARPGILSKAINPSNQPLLNYLRQRFDFL